MIERIGFGRTGHHSTRVIFGAAGVGGCTQDRADRALETLDRYGVNHLDTAASYGDSELRLAPWLATRRNDFFLATKTGERTGDGARAELERSLERLGTDYVDLIQLHNLVEPGEWEVAHGPGGAVEAMVAARDEGLCRFIGVTGHGLRICAMHVRSLERFDFDSVLFPYNHALMSDDGYRADAEALIATCRERDVATQTIKSVARRRWAPDDEQPHFSWYEPLTDPDAIGRAARFVLGRDGLFLNTSSDLRLLEPTLEAASAAPLSVPTDEEMEADAAAHGIRPLFDGAELERI
ncbi:MAG: aldo/keto reductase [Actinomycetota bacterium]|nr:aldo/keto reductase [Actinomycetota bacterium]